MSSSASAIADELVTVLAGIASVGSGNATKSGYDILESTTSQCCFMVRPTGGDNNFANFGDAATPYDKQMTLRAEGFVRDAGDAATYLNAQFTLIQAVQDAIDDKRTLNSTVEMAWVERWDVPDNEWNIGGAVWQPINFHIKCWVTN